MRRTLKPYVKRVKKRVKAARGELSLRSRWSRALARLDASGDADQWLKSTGEVLQYCDAVYINLEHRRDRRQQIEEELRQVGFTRIRRFDAVKAVPGTVGCAQSHELVLAGWTAPEGRLLIVCEDDCQFVVSSTELQGAIAEFFRNPLLDVLAIANSTRWQIPISPSLAVSADIQTTACYAIKPRAIPELIECARDSVRRLRSGEAPKTAAIDMVWKEMQQRRFFAVPRQQIAVQRAGHSDIEDRWVSYGR